MGPSLELVLVHLDDILSFRRVNSTTPLSLVSFADLVRIYLILISVSLMKTLNNPGPNVNM